MNYLNKEDFDFPTTPEYTKEDIRRVQAVLLDMTKQVCGILEKHNIPYFMAFGTLIGAVKFGGFLPWDDDVDLFLFNETYDKALYHLEKELPKHLLVHSEKNDPMYYPAWNSVRNIQTEIFDAGIYNPDHQLLKYRCLGVDLYRLKKMPANEIQNYKTNEAIKFFKRKHKAGIIDESFLIEKMNDLRPGLTQKDGKSKRSSTEVYMFMVKLKRHLEKEHIFPLRKYKFEDLNLFGPNDYDAVLKASFDDHETMPDYKERKPHLTKVFFNNLIDKQ